MAQLRRALGLPPLTASPSLPSEENSSLRVEVEDEGPWKGRMQVIGAGVGGVSLGDCVTQARDAAFLIANSVVRSAAEGEEEKA